MSGPVDIAGLAAWVRRLGNPDDPLGVEARAVCLRESGLSPPMVDWALRTTAARYTPEALAALGAGAGRPGERVGVVLSASVGTAPIRAVVGPVAGGARVWVRASRRQPAFAGWLLGALGRAGFAVEAAPADPDAFLAFARGHVDRVVATGSDAALAAMDAALPEVAFEGRGHGFGAVWVAEPDADPAPVALDVAAYDQHGCLSPQLVAVAGDDPRPFAERLHRALLDVERVLPRGAVDPALGARIVQWIGAAAAGGTLWRGPTHAVAALDGAVPGSPGARHVAVVAVPDVAALVARLGPARRFVTTVGVADAADLAGTLTEILAPARVVPAGTMQDPPLDGPEDPRPPVRRAATTRR